MVARDDLIFTESKIFFMLTAFFYCFKVIGDLEKQIEGMKRTIERKGTELQLFPVIVGEDLKNITSSYIVLDDRPIRVESSLRAIEVSFKAYHALHWNYSK